MGSDICRAEAQISISESDKCLIPSSTFQHFSGLSEYVPAYAHLHRIFTHPRSTHLGRRHAASWIWTTPAELLNGSWRFVRVLVLSVHQGRSVWKSHNLKKKKMRVVWQSESQGESICEISRGKKAYTMHIQLYSHITQKKNRQTNPTIMTILEAFYLKPCESTDNGLWVRKYTLAITIHHHSPSVENTVHNKEFYNMKIIYFIFPKYKQHNIIRKLQRT